MSKITISNLQTEENFVVELQSIDAHSIVGGSDKEGKGYGKKEGGKRGEGYYDKGYNKGYGYKGEYEDDDDHGKGRGYYPPVHFPPVYSHPRH